jgi:hypothetical protein
LPLPLDVSSTLLKIIGLTYPGTLIADDGHDWKHERQLVLHIPHSERHRNAKGRKKYLAEKDERDAWVGSLTELGPNSVGVSPHESLVKMWVDLARETMAMFPDAENYLETTAFDKATNDRYVFYVARSEKQTPHALRLKAEERVAELERRVQELEDELRLSVTGWNDHLDDLIDRWHHSSPDDPTPLHEYLGMSWEEYGAWVKDPTAIPARWLKAPPSI